MNLKDTSPIPEPIVQLQRQLDQFRSAHPHRPRLPKALWQGAVELARQHGLYPVAHLLRLDYMQCVFSAVVIPVAMQHFMLLQRNLIYTGVTLATQFLVIVGQKKALGFAVRNDQSRKRYSGLLSSLKETGR